MSSKGEITRNHCDQMKRWAVHYNELFSRENVVTDSGMNAIATLPVMKTLDEILIVE